MEWLCRFHKQRNKKIKIMKFETILPTLLIVIHALTAFVYLINLNLPKAIYWTSALH